MQTLQRGILILLAIGILVLPEYMEYRQVLFFLETWACAQNEVFFEEMCRTGKVTEEQYELHRNAMRLVGKTQLRIQEYREVFSVDGRKAYELVTWDEIGEKLRSGSYTFDEGSELRFYTENEIYYGLVGIGGYR